MLLLFAFLLYKSVIFDFACFVQLVPRALSDLDCTFDVVFVVFFEDGLYTFILSV